MPASSVAQILIRLYALNAGLQGLIQLVASMVIASQTEFYLSAFAGSLMSLVAGAILWVVAPRICRLAAGENDEEVKLEGVTLEQLFATTLLGLGIYFALGSFANVFNWIHYFTVSREPGNRIFLEDPSSFYPLTESVLTLAVGIGLAFSARQWAKKLCRKTTGESG